jgi:hypothetical protein
MLADFCTFDCFISDNYKSLHAGKKELRKGDIPYVYIEKSKKIL